MISLTYRCFFSVILIPKDKSKINQNGHILCGMDATGGIFRFGGILVQVYFHLMTVAKPYCTFSYIYFLILETALLIFAGI